MGEFLPERDALRYRLPDGAEIEITCVVLDGEDIIHERDAEALADTLREVLEQLDQQN